MRDAEPLARDLSELSAAGLEALEYLSGGPAPPPAWREERLALVERVTQKKTEVGLAVLPAVKLLVVAASEASRLQTMSPAEWRAHVTALAEAKK